MVTLKLDKTRLQSHQAPIIMALYLVPGEAEITEELTELTHIILIFFNQSALELLLRIRALSQLLSHGMYVWRARMTRTCVL